MTTRIAVDSSSPSCSLVRNSLQRPFCRLQISADRLLRLAAVWGLFLHGCSEVSKQRANDNRVMSFMTSLKAFGSLFILAVPTVVTFASLIIAP